MNAKQLYTYLSTKYNNHYFGSYEELNIILDNATLPCIVVIPVLKQVSFIANRFKIVESVVVASLAKMDLDFSTSAIYDVVNTLENSLLANLYPYEHEILSYQSISELNKFDAGVVFAAFSIDIVNNPICL